MHLARTAAAKSKPVSAHLALLLIFAVVLIAVYFHVAVSGANPGWDFEHYYAGAQIVRAGLGHQLYDISVQHRFETQYGHGPGAVFDYPAATSLLYWPTTFLTLNCAFFAWTVFSMIIAWFSVWLLVRSLKIAADPTWPIFLAMAFYPLQNSFIAGQVDCVLLLAFTLSFAALNANKPFAAGLALALALIKFHLVLPVVFFMLLRREWHFLTGFFAGSTIVAAVCFAVSGMAQLTAYPRLLLIMQSLPRSGFAPWLMPNLRGLIALLSGRELPFWLLAAISILALLWAATRSRELHIGTAFSLAITITLATAYHLYVYDLVLLIIPLRVLARRTPPWDVAKIIIFGLLVVPLLPWLATVHGLTALLVIPVLFLIPALIQSAHPKSAPPFDARAVAPAT